MPEYIFRLDGKKEGSAKEGFTKRNNWVEWQKRRERESNYYRITNRLTKKTDMHINIELKVEKGILIQIIFIEQ